MILPILVSPPKSTTAVSSSSSPGVPVMHSR
jgi:hypothetical protein